MNRRSFIRTGTMAAAAAGLHAYGGAAATAHAATRAGRGRGGSQARALKVTIHGGFAQIYRSQGSALRSLLFGPARAFHAHPHGIRLRIAKSALRERPQSEIPFGVVRLDNANQYVWDLAGWNVEVRPDGERPSAAMSAPAAASPLSTPTPESDWNRLAHIPDLTAYGAGPLRSDFRNWMSASVLLHSGTVTVKAPSQRCAALAVLRFGDVAQPVSDVLEYDIAFGETIDLGVQGLGLNDVAVTLKPSGNTLNAIVDFVPVAGSKYTDGQSLHHYADLFALGTSGTGRVPTYFQKSECIGDPEAGSQESPGIFCPPGRYAQSL